MWIYEITRVFRLSPDCSDDLVEGVRLTGPLLITGRLPRDLEDHVLDVLGNLIVHVRHVTPSKGT
jgi:hypothetical protein